MQADENKEKKVLAFSREDVLQCFPMSNKTKTAKKQSRIVGLRANAADLAIIQAGCKKHGIDQSQILRMALRRFAEAEGLKAS